VRTLSAGLTRETVQELSTQRKEPDWLREIRLQAFDAYERMPIPDQRTEGWRRTSLSGLPLDQLEVTRGSADVAGDVLDLHAALTDAHLADRIRQHFAQVVPVDADKFTALHYAFFNIGLVVYVPRLRQLETPIWIKHQGPLTHLLVIVDDEADVRLVEEVASADSPVASGVVEQVIGRNSHVRYVHLQRWSPQTWSFSYQRAHLAADAYLRTLNVALGARLARNSVQVALYGRGSQADLLGVVLTDGRQHVDFQTLQDHYGDATRSDLFIHNALRGRSSSNFTGLIRINKVAHQTESSQEQKNILLSPRSKADSDPKLEILNNDVIRCTHGAAVGPVDPEMVFYLQSRGLDVPTAERLIVEGFFQSTLSKLDNTQLEEAIWAAVLHKLMLSADNGVDR
jgi:Fe-S cluster assembly protein SufD